MPKEVIGSAMVVGGGVSGMAAARSLASQGYETHIIEKEAHLGGQARKIYSTAAGDSVPAKLAELVNNIRKNKKSTCIWKLKSRRWRGSLEISKLPWPQTAAKRSSSTEWQ